jgi:hypothetical protein
MHLEPDEDGFVEFHVLGAAEYFLGVSPDVPRDTVIQVTEAGGEFIELAGAFRRPCGRFVYLLHQDDFDAVVSFFNGRTPVCDGSPRALN